MNERTYQRKCYPDRLPRILEHRSQVDYKTLMNTLQIFSDRYPFVGITYMGTSVLGRGIPMVTMGAARGKCRSVLYVGTHHGMEHITSAVLLRFINDYCEAVDSVGRVYGVSIDNLFRCRTVHVIPQLNVDGADLQINGADGCILRDRLIAMNGGEDFSRWQANARGVDLNHNYDAALPNIRSLKRSLVLMADVPHASAAKLPKASPRQHRLQHFSGIPMRYAEYSPFTHRERRYTHQAEASSFVVWGRQQDLCPQ